MKKLIVAFIVGFVGMAAHASMIEEYRANLKTFDFETGSALAQGNVTTGIVNVTPMTNITLTFDRIASCAPKCKIAFPPIVYQVPVQKHFIGRCGEVVFTGSTGENTVDGVLTKITVVDNTHNTCKYFAAIPQTEVKMMLQGGPDHLQESHVMTGERLAEMQ